MLKPFGGLKKLFSPKTALKPFKAVHNAVTKPKSTFKALGPKNIHRNLGPKAVGKGIGGAFKGMFGGGGKKPAGGGVGNSMAARMTQRRKAPPMDEGV